MDYEKPAKLVDEVGRVVPKVAGRDQSEYAGQL